jgi:hypothetical protein
MCIYVVADFTKQKTKQKTEGRTERRREEILEIAIIQHVIKLQLNSMDQSLEMIILAQILNNVQIIQ